MNISFTDRQLQLHCMYTSRCYNEGEHRAIMEATFNTIVAALFW